MRAQRHSRIQDSSTIGDCGPGRRPSWHVFWMWARDGPVEVKILSSRINAAYVEVVGPGFAVRVDAYGHEPLWATRDLYSTRDYAETAAASINRQSGPFPLH